MKPEHQPEMEKGEMTSYIFACKPLYIFNCWAPAVSCPKCRVAMCPLVWKFKYVEG